MNNQTGGEIVANANKNILPFLEEETINYLSPNSTDDKTSVVDVKDDTQEKVVDDNGSIVEENILDTDFDTTGTKEMSDITKAKFGNVFIGNEESRQKLKDLKAAEVEDSEGRVGIEGKNLNFNEEAPPETPEIPDLNLNGDNDTADTEISARDAVKANQELFADLLGKSDARGKDISDMLLRFSGAEGTTVDEKFKEFTKLEAKAGKGRTEKINETASALAIKDYIGGKRSKEQADIYKGKIDYTQKVKMAAINVQPTDSAQEVLYKLGKKGDVKSTSDQAYKALILLKDPNAKSIIRNDKVKIKDLTGKKGANKLKKLKTGYNIIEEEGVKNIVVYDGSGTLEGVQIFNVDQLWKL